eukprot:scaffold85957_cov38-Phaeocystis_antarctica.AAC.1
MDTSALSHSAGTAALSFTPRAGEVGQNRFLLAHSLEKVAPGGMGRAWSPGAAEHVTTARGDRTDGHFGCVRFRRNGSSVVHTPCWR